MPPLQYKLGHEGEVFVRKQLEFRQWTILAQNYRGRGFELDIVALRGHSLVVFEVKTRTKPLQSQVSLETLLPLKKRRSLEYGLNHYLSHAPQSLEWQVARIDLVIVFAYRREWTARVFVNPYPIGAF